MIVPVPTKGCRDKHRAIQKLLRYNRFSDTQNLIDQSDAPVSLDDEVIPELNPKINPSCVDDTRPCAGVPHPAPDDGPNFHLFDYDDDDEFSAIKETTTR